MNPHPCCLLIVLLAFTSGINAGEKKRAGTITGMTAGDIACYVDFLDEQGQSFSEMASFTVCERTDLIDRQVRLFYEWANVLAASCEGVMDCPDTERVLLIDEVQPVVDYAAGNNAAKCFDDAASQQDMNRCSRVEYEEVDAEMDKAYAALRQKYRDDARVLEKLALSQQAWIQFREAEVAARYAYQDEPGYYGSALSICLHGLRAELTRARILQLQQWLRGPEEGEVCSY